MFYQKTFSMKYFLSICICIVASSMGMGQEVKTLSFNNKKTILYDKLTKPAAILVWYDKYYDEHSIKPCGTYNFKKFGPKRELLIEEPTLFILPIGIQVPYLIYPSDTLIFYDLGKNTPPNAGNPTLRHQRLKKRTREIKFFEEVFDSLGACFGQHSYSIPGYIQTYKEVLSFQKEKLISRLSFLDKKFEQKEVSGEFYTITKNYFLNKFYDDVFSGFNRKKYFDVSQEVDILHIADSLVRELNGREFLDYAWYEAVKSYVELKLNIKRITQNNFDSCLVSITNNLGEKERNFGVFYYYKYLINNKNLNFINSKLDLLKQLCTDQDYIEYISGNTSFIKKEEKSDKSTKTTDIILTVDKRKQKLADLVDSLKGNVIYIDFWASWCVPCIEELPFSKKLVSAFNNENVVFIFLSLDLYSTSWINAVKRNEISGTGLQYLIVDSENNFFIRKYDIGPIPRYILINKKGEVVNSDAPRPSEERTKELISQLLKE